MGKPKIVIADTSVFMRTMLKSHLESLNLDVVATARNDGETIAKCHEAKPDIALIDIGIAEKDDFGLLRAIKASPGSTCIIVMVPEQENLPEVVVEAIRAGADGYIKKPVSPQDLGSRIEMALGRGSHGRHN